MSNGLVLTAAGKAPFYRMVKKLTACPAWLEISEDRLSFVFLPDRAATVKMIYELSIAGIGGYTIAKQLNAKNIPVFGPSPKWDQSTIHNMLSNRATIGEHQPKQYRNRKAVPVGDPIPGYYPAVIDEALFNKAQVARQKNLASGRGRKGRLITNLFAGLPTCSYCGSAVKFHSNGNAKSLICETVLAGKGCYRRGWSYRNFENSFFDFVKRHESSATLEQDEREALARLAMHIRALAGPEIYDARMGIATTLKATVSELKIASAGWSPIAGKPNARIRRDDPSRRFEIRFRNGSAHTGSSVD